MRTFTWQGEKIRASFAVLFTTHGCSKCSAADKILGLSGMSFIVSNISLQGDTSVTPHMEQLLLKLKSDIIVAGIKSAPALFLFRTFPHDVDEPYDLFYDFDLHTTAGNLIINIDGNRA